MRVLHVSAGNLYGGVEVLLASLAHYHEATPGMTPHFALCYDGQNSRELSQIGAPVYHLGPARISRPGTIMRARTALAALLGEIRPDAVICHSPWAWAIFGPVARRAESALIWWAHGASDAKNWFERWAQMSPPDLIVASSRATAAAVHTKFRRAPTEVCYPPLPAWRHKESAESRCAVRAALGADDGDTVIIQVSRMESGKGHRVLLSALHRMRGLDGWKCWIAGGAQRLQERIYEKELHRAAEAFGLTDRVRFLGQRPDIMELVHAADLFCHPHTEPEAFGIACAEALSAGLPVITSASGGTPEIVDATCGRIVPAGSTSELEAALRALIADPSERTRLGSNGQVKVWRLFDPVQQLSRLHALVCQTIERQHPIRTSHEI